MGIIFLTHKLLAKWMFMSKSSVFSAGFFLTGNGTSGITVTWQGVVESATTPHWRSSQTMVVKTGHGIIAAESRARGISGAEDVE